MWNYISSNELMHFGVKGMRWGVRRYQNEDGSLTPAGQKRYSSPSQMKRKDLEEQFERYATSDAGVTSLLKQHSKIQDEYAKSAESKAYRKASDNFYKDIASKMNSGRTKEVGKKTIRVEADDKLAKALQIAESKAKSKQLEITKKYMREYAKQMVKDLNYSDIESGADWLIENGYIR